MLSYILQRIVRVIPQLLLISILAFIIIQLPPGDIVTQRIQNLRASGVEIDERQAEAMMRQYGVDKPFHLPCYLAGESVQSDHRRYFIVGDSLIVLDQDQVFIYRE